ncbi:MAG: hypothetical protein IT580_01035 [Verrucomicrobiales bacterium]|nr:hypothetical protein [Verrucomicrobiales bacterium]
MRIEPIRWQHWDAMRCLTPDCELVVGISAGPRILSLRSGSTPNLLYQDTTDFRVGAWRLHGGHRFTVGPEDATSYHPDNAPCTVDIDIEDGDQELRVAAPPGPDGLQRILNITAARDGAGFDLRHQLRNTGHQPWQGALWCITCVPPTGPVLAPVPQQRLRFWPGSDPAPWSFTHGHLVLHPNGSRGKVGWHGEAAWLALLHPAATLVIQGLDSSPREECIDEGCNAEIFTCADYRELETLGGRVGLAPGEETSHRQRWRVLDAGYTPHDGPLIGARAGCTPITCLHEP